MLPTASDVEMPPGEPLLRLYQEPNRVAAESKKKKSSKAHDMEQR